MTYQGSKQYLREFILPIITEMRKPNQPYWEPFLGSASIFVEVPGPKMGTDIHPDLIMLWNALITNTFNEPGVVTKDQYNTLMDSTENSALRGYAGFFYSFSGMFDKGYSMENFTRSASFHSMQKRAAELAKQQGMYPVVVKNCSYDKPNVSGALIYCDPPYINTTGYRGTPDFDHTKFYNWCRSMATHNTLLISEYTMPPDFRIVAEKPYTTNMSTANREKEGVERLYTI